jgi:hypothetical protein
MESEKKVDETLKSSPEKFEVIKNDAIINVQISSSFYKRMQLVYQNLLKDKDKNDIESAFTQMKDKNITDSWVYDLETMLIIIMEFQKNAKTEGKIELLTKEEIDEIVEKSLKENQK